MLPSEMLPSTKPSAQKSNAGVNCHHQSQSKKKSRLNPSSHSTSKSTAWKNSPCCWLRIRLMCMLRRRNYILLTWRKRFKPFSKTTSTSLIFTKLEMTRTVQPWSILWRASSYAFISNSKNNILLLNTSMAKLGSALHWTDGASSTSQSWLSGSPSTIWKSSKTTGTSRRRKSTPES